MKIYEVRTWAMLDHDYFKPSQMINKSTFLFTKVGAFLHALLLALDDKHYEVITWN